MLQQWRQRPPCRTCQRSTPSGIVAYRSREGLHHWTWNQKARVGVNDDITVLTLLDAILVLGTCLQFEVYEGQQVVGYVCLSISIQSM